MTEFTFQATLIASIKVKAATSVRAEHMLREALSSSEANFEMLDDQPIIVMIEIEGSLDLIDSLEGSNLGDLSLSSA